MSPSANLANSGITLPRDAPETRYPAGLSIRAAPKSAPTGSFVEVVQIPACRTSTNAQDAGAQLTERKNAVVRRRAEPLSAFNVEGWERLLKLADLLEEFGEIPRGLRYGFIIGTPVIRHTMTPPNSPSLSILSEQFASIVSNEFRLNRYLGPFSKVDLENMIGHFQTSPMSLIPKPHKPGAFRLVQNFSFPKIPRENHTSINHHINSDDFPCTWGTFASFALTVFHLPPGSQGAVRDVSEAYRNIPLHPSQWASTVVRLSEKDEFAIDTQAAFGVASNAGMFGLIADGINCLMRKNGIGPLSKWVNDHGFFRILRKYLQSYNIFRAQCAQSAEAQGGRRHVGGRIFWSGDIMPNDSIEEFV